MTPAGVFKRLTAVAGMALLVPICVGLITGSVDPIDAGIRAVLLFVGVAVVRRIANLAPSGSRVVVVEEGGGESV